MGLLLDARSWKIPEFAGLVWAQFFLLLGKEEKVGDVGNRGVFILKS